MGAALGVIAPPKTGATGGSAPSIWGIGGSAPKALALPPPHGAPRTASSRRELATGRSPAKHFLARPALRATEDTVMHRAVTLQVPQLTPTLRSGVGSEGHGPYPNGKSARNPVSLPSERAKAPGRPSTAEALRELATDPLNTSWPARPEGIH